MTREVQKGEGVLTFLTQELHIFSWILAQKYDFLKLHYVEILLRWIFIDWFIFICIFYAKTN